MKEIIKNSLQGHKEALGLLEDNCQKIEEIASFCISAFKKGGKIIFFGNGGSAADAQHLAGEFVGRFKRNRLPLAALALSSNISTLTAIGNDFGFPEVFARQIQAYADPDDIAVALSTSGKSENVRLAVEKAKEKEVKTVGFLGKDGGDLIELADISLVIPSDDTPRIQEMHILAGHIVCEIIEEHFF